MGGRDDEGASNGIRDMVALNTVEMLPWDAWGAQPKPNEVLDQDQLAFFGSLVELTREPNAYFDEIQRLYASDSQLSVPPMVFNSLLNRAEKWRD
jgi:hypothetical protein